MGLLGPLASLLGIETDLLLQRIKESAVAFAAIGLFVVIAFSFMLVALYNYLLTWIGPIWAPLAIAGGRGMAGRLALPVFQRLTYDALAG